MTPNVMYVRPDLPIPAALELLLEQHISAAPVVGEDGELLGVVSKTDLLGVDQQDPERARETVDRIMMPLVFAVHEEAAVAQAAGLMAVEGIHRVVVVSPRGELVGILSALDVMRWLAEREGYLGA